VEHCEFSENPIISLSPYILHYSAQQYPTLHSSAIQYVYICSEFQTRIKEFVMKKLNVLDSAEFKNKIMEVMVYF
jgi:hypothetical protein